MRRRPLPVLVAVALALTACTSAATAPPKDATQLPFRPCGEVACTGTLAGARYEIVLPASWNGTLLIYSHGYRAAQPVPPALEPVVTTAEPAPGWSSGEKQIGQQLLDQGYALAGSSYASNGWAVTDGVRAGEDLYTFFRDNVGAPARVYAWGDSLGGLVTTLLAEKHADWVSGAAPVCAPLAGLVPNMDLALDVSYAVRELLDPGFQVAGYPSYEVAIRQFQGAAEKVLAAAKDGTGRGGATLLAIAALVDAPTQTQRSDGSTPASRVDVAVEGILTALGFGTFARYDVERRAGGTISDNASTSYADRVDAADRAAIDSVAPGTVARVLAALDKGRRISADPAARTTAFALGDPTGDVAVPTLSLHTRADPLVIVQNEAWYAARAAARGDDRLSRLLQLVTVAPATFPAKPGAPYGAGHCNVTPASRVGLIALLDGWVRSGSRPSTAAVSAALGPASGYVADAVAPSWPRGGLQPAT